MLLRRRRRAERAPPPAGTAPSRRTRGSGPVRSTTVDGVPGKLARVEHGGDAVEDLVGTSATRADRSRRAGSRSSPRRRRRAREGRRRAADVGDADADRVGARRGAREPPRRIGDDERERPRHEPDAPAAPGSARRGRRRSTRRARSAARASGCLSAERAHGVLSIRPAGEAVDRVGRDDDELARLDRARPSRRPCSRARTPSTTRSRPARSCVVATSDVSEARRAAPRRARRRRRRPRARAHRRARARRAHRARRPRSPPRRRAPRAAPSRAPPARARRSPRAGRTAGSRRRDPTARRGARRDPTRGARSRARSASVRAGDLERAGDASTPVTSARDARRRSRARSRRSRPDVEDARLGEPGDPRETALDDDLRLRPRNEHAAVDGERQPPEAPLAEHVRERLACLAPRDEPLELLLLVRESLRAARARAPTAEARGRAPTRISASTRGDSQPASARRSRSRASARATFTRRRRRAPGAAPRRAAPR